MNCGTRHTPKLLVNDDHLRHGQSFPRDGCSSSGRKALESHPISIDYQPLTAKAAIELLQAIDLEKAAVMAYLKGGPWFSHRGHTKTGVSIMDRETPHWVVLHKMLGKNPVPAWILSGKMALVKYGGEK